MRQYNVSGMSCAACQARVEKAVSSLEGVTSCSVSLLTNSLGVEGSASDKEIIAAVEKAGYGASPRSAPEGEKTASARLAAEEEALRDKETPLLKKRLIASVGFLVILMYVTMGHNMLGWPVPSFLEHNHLGLGLLQMILALIVMVINHRFFTGGFKSLFHLAPNMDTLVALGSTVSFAWSVFVLFRMTVMITGGADNMELMEMYHDQLYFESAAMIPALITVGKMLEAMSKGRTTNALKSLMKLAPKTANVERGGIEQTVDIDDVRAGDIFVVRPGESIPVDGVVIEGESAVDEAALTGESVPADKTVGDKVSAATINRSGFIRCRAERVGEDTTLSQIIKMVSDAAATKAPVARIADKVSGIFVPVVIAIAVVVFAGWLIAGAGLSPSLERAIAVLVIACPCALGLATPVAIMVGNGLGAGNGILFKTSEALEEAGKIEIIALDKTGTITSGKPAVTDIFAASGYSEEELMKKAFALEKKSEHPLAIAITDEYERKYPGVEASEASRFKALAGNGLEAVIDGRLVRGGSRRYISSLADIDGELSARAEELAMQGKTPLFFEEEGRLIGLIAVADVIRESSADAIASLKNMGIRVVMLTGDNEVTAAAIGKAAGVDEIVSGVLPDEKEAVIRRLKESGKTAMAGDGINDAPALTRADIGIAIGAGTDVAIDSADIVLMNSDLEDVAAAIRLSRATLRNIHENLFWAFIYNIICIPLAAGLFVWKMNPMIAAAAMALSSFTVCLNALRLNLFRLHDKKYDRPRKRTGKRRREDSIDIKEKGSMTMEKTIKIEGMMCGHCEATVKKALEELPFVEEARPSHEDNNAVVVISGEYDEAAVKAAVEAKDYKFIG